MLKLTPFRETTSVQEVLQEHSIEMLMSLMKAKFSLLPEIAQDIEARLEQLPLAKLEDLFKDILVLDTLEQLRQWIENRLPQD